MFLNLSLEIVTLYKKKFQKTVSELYYQVPNLKKKLGFDQIIVISQKKN